ncbi:MAG: EamA family transporter [Clostridia bacterium]|nr:EamA family transporter [Clostridia bacterium]
MKKLSLIFIVLAGSLWGITGIFIRNMNKYGLDAMQIGAVRLIISAVVFSVITCIKSPSLFKIKIKHIWMFIGTGIISVVFFNYFYFNTIIQGEVSVAVVLLYTSPVFVMIMSAILFKEKITPVKIIAVFFTVIGCALSCGLFGGGYKISLIVLIFGLLSGLFYALYSIFGKYALNNYNTYTVTAYTFIFAGIGACCFVNIGDTVRIITENPILILWILGITLFCTVLPYLFYTLGLKDAESSTASIVVAVEPVVGAIIGMVFLGDTFSAFKILGILIIISAIVLMNLKTKKKSE